MIKIVPFDASEYLQSEEAVAEYLTAAFETGDPAFIAASLGDVARARGMSELARQTGLSRESLYKALSPKGNPEFATVVRVMQAFNLQLSAMVQTQPKRKKSSRRKFVPA